MKSKAILTFILLFATVPILYAQERDICIEKPTGRKFAFLVGVTEYEHPNNFPTLTYTVQDVTAWRKQLEGVGFEPDNIVVMASNTSVSRQPTKRKILASLDGLLQKTTENDIIICMFSGHGTQIGKDQYFCPEDARVDDLADSCVPLNEVLESLKKSPAKFKWLIVDACRNDPSKSMPGGVKSIGKVESVPKGVTAIFSCAETEKSYEDTVLEHGVFTHFLMQGLAGKAADKNGIVTILDLYKYVQEETRVFVKSKHNRNQIPYWNGEFTNFIIRDDLLVEGVSREKWLQADVAYKQAQEYRRKKEYEHAVAEIEKALAILPDKGAFLDEKQMIELLAVPGAPSSVQKPSSSQDNVRPTLGDTVNYTLNLSQVDLGYMPPGWNGPSNAMVNNVGGSRCVTSNTTNSAELVLTDLFRQPGDFVLEFTYVASRSVLDASGKITDAKGNTISFQMSSNTGTALGKTVRFGNSPAKGYPVNYVSNGCSKTYTITRKGNVLSMSCEGLADEFIIQKSDAFKTLTGFTILIPSNIFGISQFSVRSLDDAAASPISPQALETTQPIVSDKPSSDESNYLLSIADKASAADLRELILKTLKPELKVKVESPRGVSNRQSTMSLLPGSKYVTQDMCDIFNIGEKYYFQDNHIEARKSYQEFVRRYYKNKQQ